MKTKILSPEALAAIVAGKTVEAKAETNLGETPEVTPETPETEASTTEETETPDFTGQIEALTTEKTDLEAKVETMAKTISDLEAAALSVDAKIKAAEEEVNEFKGIVVGHIAAMRIGLSLSAVDMKNWTAEAILREYASTTESFEKSFLAGSRVPETTTVTEKPKPVISSSHDAADYKALGFK